MCRYVTLTNQFNNTLLFVHSWIVKQFYLAHRWYANRYDYTPVTVDKIKFLAKCRCFEFRIFFFLETGCHTKAKELCLPCNLLKSAEFY